MFIKKRIYLVLLLFFYIATQSFAQEQADIFEVKNSPYIAGALSMVFPGSGYLFLGKPLPGLLSAALTVPLPLGAGESDEDFLQTAGFQSYLHISNGLYQFSIYDTFQTGLDLQGRPKQVVNIPHYSLLEMFSSVVNPRTYDFRYTTSAITYFTMFALPIGITAYNIVNKGILPAQMGDKIDISRLAIALPIVIIKSLMMGAGEEGFYKGFMMPVVSQLAGNGLTGNIIQSLHFGFNHTAFAKNLPLISDIPLGTTSTYNQKLSIFKDGESIPAAGTGKTVELPEIAYFLLYSLAAYQMGDIVLHEKDGLLKAAAYNSIFNTVVLIGDLLTQGYIDTFYFEVTFSLY